MKTSPMLPKFSPNRSPLGFLTKSNNAGGASMRCSSGRGGATLFNTFGLIFTAGPGGGETGGDAGAEDCGWVVEVKVICME